MPWPLFRALTVCSVRHETDLSESEKDKPPKVLLARESDVRTRRKYPHNEAIKVENITLTRRISGGSLSLYLLYQVSRRTRAFNCILVNFTVRILGPPHFKPFTRRPESSGSELCQRANRIFSGA